MKGCLFLNRIKCRDADLGYLLDLRIEYVEKGDKLMGCVHLCCFVQCVEVHKNNTIPKKFILVAMAYWLTVEWLTMIFAFETWCARKVLVRSLVLSHLSSRLDWIWLSCSCPPLDRNSLLTISDTLFYVLTSSNSTAKYPIHEEIQV